MQAVRSIARVVQLRAATRVFSARAVSARTFSTSPVYEDDSESPDGAPPIARPRTVSGICRKGADGPPAAHPLRSALSRPTRETGAACRPLLPAHPQRPTPTPTHTSPQGDVVSSIVQGVEEDRAGRDSGRHTLAVLVDNEAGVLAKVAGMLSSRGFNIDSLTVSPTNLPDLSRMTVVLTDVPAAGACCACACVPPVCGVQGLSPLAHDPSHCCRRRKRA